MSARHFGQRFPAGALCLRRRHATERRCGVDKRRSGALYSGQLTHSLPNGFHALKRLRIFNRLVEPALPLEQRFVICGLVQPLQPLRGLAQTRQCRIVQVVLIHDSAGQRRGNFGHRYRPVVPTGDLLTAARLYPRNYDARATKTGTCRLIQAACTRWPRGRDSAGKAS
jgi:hypothetical protein